MAQLHAIGSPRHEAEAAAIRFLERELPNAFHLYANVYLPTGRRAAETYEHDVIAVCPHGVFTVELKAYGGAIRGNRDRWQLADGAFVPSPIPLTEDKARVLKSLIAAKGYDLRPVYVQGVIFTSPPDADPQLTPGFANFVHTRRTIVKALTDPDYFGLTVRLSGPQQARIGKVITDGGVPPQFETTVGDFDLIERVPAPGALYQAHLASHRFSGLRRILHSYALTTEEPNERERFRAHALREATLHEKLHGVPDILRMHGHFTTSDPPRVVLPFEDTTAFCTLETWLGEFPRAALSTRLGLALRVARALAAVHKAGVVHRRLSSATVLVEPAAEPGTLRLCAFELGKDLLGGVATVSGSLLRNPALRCVAPEVLRLGETTPLSDLFNFGALLVELLTGTALFKRPEDVLAVFEVPALRVDGQPVPDALQQLVAALLAVEPARRPESAQEVAARLEALDQRIGPAMGARPGALTAGLVLRDHYELSDKLGEGASGETWKARHLLTGTALAVKVAAPDRAASLDVEWQVAGAVQHPALVRVANREALPDGRVLLTTHFVEGFGGRLWIEAGDPISAPQARAIAEGLYGALGALHTAGWLHRDVKPENLTLQEPTLAPVLLDLGVACRTDSAEASDLIVGSVAYKDPALWRQSSWTPAQDLYAAALVLWELLTGLHPFGRRAPDAGAEPELEASLLPDGFDADGRARLVAFFKRNLAPEPAARDALAAGARAAFLAALAGGPASQSLLPLRGSVPELPRELSPDSPLATLNLSVRATRALRGLGLTRVGELAQLASRRLTKIANVGRKTAHEIDARIGQVQARWPDLVPDAEPPAVPAPDAPPPVAPTRVPAAMLYPDLMGDTRPLAALGPALVPALKAWLLAQGLDTVGALAAFDPAALTAPRGVGRRKIEVLRKALVRLHDPSAPPESLAALHRTLARDLPPAVFAALDAMLGLTDGQARTLGTAAERLSVTRQAIDQHCERALTELRAAASPGALLTAVVDDATGPLGFVALPALAAALAQRFPVDGPTPSALGYARLAAIVAVPDARVSHLHELTAAVREPWTRPIVRAAVAEFETACAWPPLPRAAAAAAAWQRLPAAVRDVLTRRGLTALALVDGLRALSDNVKATPDGALYVPPSDFPQALRYVRPTLAPGLSLAELLAEVERALPGVMPPADRTQLDEALAAVGLQRAGEHVVDPAQVVAAEPAPAPKVDRDVERQVVPRPHDPLPPVVAALAASVARGGFRVVALPPGQHHQLSEELAGWLAAELEPARVRFVDVDHELVRAFKDAGLWADALFFDGRADATWGWAEPVLRAQLERVLAGARPGTVTVLARPALLGTLGLVPWLSEVYERARGGRHGLLVLALPGGVREGRIWLNDARPMPYAPDMAPVYLERLDEVAA